MSDPVQEYLQKYGPGEAPADPVQEYLSRYATPKIAADTAITSDAARTPLTGVVEEATAPQPKTDQDALRGMYELLKRPHLTEQQRTRINRLIHSMRRGMIEDAAAAEKPDPLLHQLALAATSEGLGMYQGVLSTVGKIPGVGALNKIAAEKIGEFRAGIEPTPDPNRPVASGLAQAAGAVTGVSVAAPPIFRGARAIAKGTTGSLAALAPRAAGVATRGTQALASRVLARTGSKRLAAAIEAAPVELLAGGIFQGLVDPESLTTSHGIAMAFLFGSLGALGEGVRVTRLAEREAAAAKAKEQFESLVGKETATAVEAEILAKAAETKAAKLAYATAMRAWSSATPEMRKALMPEWETQTLSVRWRVLTKEQKDLVIAKVRAAAADSKLNKAADTGEPLQEPPAPVLDEAIEAAHARQAAEPATAPTATELVTPGVPSPPTPKAVPSEPPAGRPPGVLAVADYYDTPGARELGKAVKEGSQQAIAQMAEQMASQVPADAVLIPIPSSTGRATYTLQIAQELAKRTGRPVADVLRGQKRPSLKAVKKAKGKIDIKNITEGEIPQGTPILVDNVLETGQTARAAQAVIPNSQILVHSISTGRRAKKPPTPPEQGAEVGERPAGEPVSTVPPEAPSAVRIGKQLEELKARVAKEGIPEENLGDLSDMQLFDIIDSRPEAALRTISERLNQLRQSYEDWKLLLGDEKKIEYGHATDAEGKVTTYKIFDQKSLSTLAERIRRLTESENQARLVLNTKKLEASNREPSVSPEAPRVEPAQVDVEIARLEAQVKDVSARLQQAERRVNAAERAAQVDVTGVQSKRAWEGARGRLESDAGNRVALIDVKQLKALNDTKGQAAGDEFLREVANALNNALGQGEQAFRVGGDEFIVSSTVSNIEGLMRRVLAQLPERSIEGTPYTLGLRYAIDRTYEGASRVLAEVKKGETGPKARVVETTKPEEVIPQAESVPQPQVGEKPAKAKKERKPKEVKGAPKERTLKDLDKDVDKLDADFEANKIDEATYSYRLEKLAAERRAIKAKQAAAEAKPAGPVLTRRQLDESAVRNMALEQLQAEAERLRVQREAFGTDPIRSEEIKHDLHVVAKEIRMKKSVAEMSDAALDTHANELAARLMETPKEQQGPIRARLAELDAEFKKRARPNPVDTIHNERGAIYAVPDPLESSATGLAPHSQRIQDMIEINLEGDKPFPSMSDLMRKVHNLYSHLVRATHEADLYAKELGLSKAPAVRNPGVWAELVSGSFGRAQRMLQFGTYRWDAGGNLIDSGRPGMAQILAPFKGRLNQLRRYEVARYTIELAAREKKTGIALLDAIREVENAPADIVKAADDLVHFRRGVLDYLTDSGMFSKEARASLEQMTQAYVPLYRYFEGKGVLEKVETYGAKLQEKKALVGAGKQVQRLVGSIRKIVDPLRSTVDQTRRFVRAADINRLSTMLVDAAERNPEAARGLVWKESRVRTSIDQSITQQADLLMKGAAQHGVKMTSEVALEIATGLNERRLRTRSDQLQVWRNGKREVWNISPELAAMYESFQPYQMHWALRILGFIPQAAKTGITDNPVFGFFNATKDTFDAAIQSQYGFRIGADSFTGFLHSIRNSKYRQEFLAGAGTAGGITGRATQTTRRALEAVLPKTGYERIMHPIVHPIQALRELSIPFEEAARLGEYIRARQAGAPVMDAAIASMRVTTNFRQRGLSMQGINHIVMFLNPAIQSLDTNIRAMARNPGRVAAVGVGAITIPSVLLWAANKDDKQIQELRRSRFGGNYWYYRKNDGRIGRIAKPWLFGTIFGTGVEDALDAMYAKDPTAGERFIASLVHNIPYNPLPTTLNLTLGLLVNRDFSTGAPIAPDRLERGDGEVEDRWQVRPETGATARQIGDVLDVSPAKIEFFIRSSLGTLGQDVLRVVDRVNDARDKYPAPVDADMPVIGRLLARYPSAGAFSLRRFYNNARDHEKVVNSMHVLEKKGDTARLKEYIQEHREELGLAEAYADMRKELADLRAATEGFAVLPQEAMSSEEKRRVINKLTEAMINRARAFNEVVDKIKRERADSISNQRQPVTGNR